MRVKCKCGYSHSTLAHHVRIFKGRKYDEKNWILHDEYISVFLPRIINTQKFKKEYADTIYSWDDLFSHIVSHEFIHAVISREISGKASNKFDNIEGHLPKNPFETYAGLRL
jgi:hypothetical protein